MTPMRGAPSRTRLAPITIEPPLVTDPLARPSRSGFRSFVAISTRWSDNDIYRHVNNVVHYSWFDTAVNSLLLERGVLELEGDGPIFLVVETACRYFAPLAFPGAVDVGLGIERLGATSVTWRLGIFPEGSDQGASSGRFVHVCVDRATRSPVRISDAARDRLAGI